jgi:hypothetical protein
VVKWGTWLREVGMEVAGFYWRGGTVPYEFADTTRISFVLPSEIPPCFYEVFITEYHQAVNQKCQEIQYTIYLVGMVFPMSKIMLQVVSVVFKDVVLILYLPTGPDAVCQQLDILFGDRFVRYPTVFVDNLAFLQVIRFKIKVMYPQFLLFRPIFNAVYPPVPVFKTAFPPPFGNNTSVSISLHLTYSAIQGCDSSLQVNRKLKPRSTTALQVL